MCTSLAQDARIASSSKSEPKVKNQVLVNGLFWPIWPVRISHWQAQAGRRFFESSLSAFKRRGSTNKVIVGGLTGEISK